VPIRTTAAAAARRAKLVQWCYVVAVVPRRPHQGTILIDRTTQGILDVARSVLADLDLD